MCWFARTMWLTLGLLRLSIYWRPSVRFRKIFNISMHRSGTQSVHDLVRCRISSVRFPRWVKGVNYENLVAGSEDDTLYVADVLAPVFEMVTAVSDVPIPALYDTLDDMYPNSAFILVS